MPVLSIVIPAFLRDAPSRWFTIPAHRPFVEDLAAVLLAELAPAGPEALADAVVLVPTRRGARIAKTTTLTVITNRVMNGRRRWIFGARPSM